MSQLTRPAANAGASAITGGNRTLPFSQIEQAWIQAGGPPQWAATMAAITYFESGGNPSSVQQQCPASESTNGQDGGPCRYQDQGWGLWQITPGDSESQVGTNQALLDPVTNARAAVAKFNSQGIGAWQGDPIGNAAARMVVLSIAARSAASLLPTAPLRPFSPAPPSRPEVAARQQHKVEARAVNPVVPRKSPFSGTSRCWVSPSSPESMLASGKRLAAASSSGPVGFSCSAERLSLS